MPQSQACESAGNGTSEAILECRILKRQALFILGALKSFSFPGLYLKTAKANFKNSRPSRFGFLGPPAKTRASGF
jgi:hypothetical protein